MKRFVFTHIACFYYGGVLMLLCFLLWLPFSLTTSLPSYEQAKQALSNHIIEDELDEQDAKFIRRSYGLSTDQYTSASIYRKHAAMDVEEIAIFQITDRDEAAVVKGCEERIRQQIESFAGYGEKQVEQLQKAVLLHNEEMVILIIDEEPKQIEQLLREKAKEGNAV